MVAEVKEYRSILIEGIATYDENLLESIWEDENSITEEEINNALRAATIDMAIIPMFVVLHSKTKGSIHVGCSYVNICHLH